jgi:hypothetical protein
MGCTDDEMGWIVGPMSLVLAATPMGNTAKVCRRCTHLRASHRVRGESGRALHRVRAQLRGDPVARSRTEIGDRMVPDGKSSQAKGAEEGSSSAMGKRGGQK